MEKWASSAGDRIGWRARHLGGRGTPTLFGGRICLGSERSIRCSGPGPGEAFCGSGAGWSLAGAHLQAFGVRRRADLGRGCPGAIPRVCGVPRAEEDRFRAVRVWLRRRLLVLVASTDHGLGRSANRGVRGFRRSRPARRRACRLSLAVAQAFASPGAMAASVPGDRLAPSEPGSTSPAHLPPDAGSHPPVVSGR